MSVTICRFLPFLFSLLILFSMFNQERTLLLLREWVFFTVNRRKFHEINVKMFSGRKKVKTKVENFSILLVLLISYLIPQALKNREILSHLLNYSTPVKWCIHTINFHPPNPVEILMRISMEKTFHPNSQIASKFVQYLSRI